MATDAELIERYGLAPTDAAADDATLMQRYGLTPVGGAAPSQPMEGTPTVLDVVQEQLEPLASRARTGAQNIGSTLQRGAAYLFPPESPARAAAVQQAGLPQQAGFFPEFAAEMVGESPVMTGTALGGMYGAGLGPVGALAGAGMGAAAGALYRHLMGLQGSDQLTPETAWQQAVPRAAQDTAWELGFAGAGPVIGRGVQAAGQWWSGLRGTEDFSKAAWNRAVQNYELGAELERVTGMRYGQTPGELLDDPHILDRERTAILRAGRDAQSGEAYATRFMDMLNERANTAQSMMGQYVRSIPPPGRVVSTRRGFSALPRKAREVVDTLYKQRSDEMSPLYAEVLGGMSRVPARDLVQRLRRVAKANAGRTRDTLRDAADELAGEMDEAGTVPAEFLHNFQSDRASAARHVGTQTKAGQKLIAEVVEPAQARLTEVSPDYANVRNEYARRSKQIEDIQERTAFGELAGIKPKAKALRRAGRSLVEPDTSPGEIRKLRKDLRLAMRELHPDPDEAAREFEDVWQGYKAAFLQNKLSQIRATGTRRGANVPQQVGKLFGSTEDAAGGAATNAQLKAMLTRGEYDRLQLLQQAFRRTSDLFSYGSATAPRLEDGRSPIVQAGVEAAATGGPGTVGTAGAWNTIMRAVPDFYDRFMRGGAAVEEAHAEAVLQGLNASMDHLRKLNRDLQKLRLADPITVESDAARLWGTLLGNIGGSAVEAAER